LKGVNHFLWIPWAKNDENSSTIPTFWIFPWQLRFSGWPLFALLRALRPQLRRLRRGQGGAVAEDFALRLRKAQVRAAGGCGAMVILMWFPKNWAVPPNHLMIKPFLEALVLGITNFKKHYSMVAGKLRND
jgi:hypothetical protein